MSLMFDDNNEVNCPSCGGNLFQEREYFVLEKSGDEYDPKYKKVQSKFRITCIECYTIIDESFNSKLNEV